MSFALSVFSDMDLPVKWITTDCNINLLIVPEYIQSPQFKLFIYMTVIILSFTSSEWKMPQVLICILILALKRLWGINRTWSEKKHKIIKERHSLTCRFLIGSTMSWFLQNSFSIYFRVPERKSGLIAHNSSQSLDNSFRFTWVYLRRPCALSVGICSSCMR